MLDMECGFNFGSDNVQIRAHGILEWSTWKELAGTVSGLKA